MRDTKIVQAWLEPSLVERFEQMINVTGETKRDVLERLIRAYLAAQPKAKRDLVEQILAVRAA
jgi:hypothetical protein